MNNGINEIVYGMIGACCTRKEVGSMRSLSLGFGEQSRERRSRYRQYRQWELGTYDSDWKIIDGTGVLIEKNQSHDIAELDARLQTVLLGRLIAIRQVSN